MQYFKNITRHGRLQQFLAVLLGTLGAISDGMQYGWTSPIIPLLQKPNSPIPISHSDILWLENIYMIGGFAGIPITIYNVDKFGRKPSILIGAIQNLVAWILIAFAPSIEYIYVGRFLTGIAANVGFVSSPIYISEIADKTIRGFLGSFIYIMMIIGVLVVYSVAPFVSILASSAVGCSFLLVQLVSFPFMPESPYYSVIKGKTDVAKKSLERLRGTKDVDKEFDEILNTIQAEKSEKGRITDFITMKNSRKAVGIMSVLNLAQHFSGYSVILMNMHSILNDAAAILSSNNISILYSGIMLGAALCASFVMDKTGRKILLSSSSVFSGISVLALAIYFTVKNAGVNVESYNWIPMVSVICYAISFKWGLGIIPIVLTAELFPTKVKAIGMTIADSMYVIGAILSVYIYQTLKDNYGIHVPFYVFSGCCLLNTIFVVFTVPETKGKSLEEIQQILSGKRHTNNHSIPEINTKELTNEQQII